MSTHAHDHEHGRWPFLGRVKAIFLAVSAVAGAIGAIVALWPSPDPGDSAKFSNVLVMTNVPLGEFNARSEFARAPRGSLPSRIVELAGITSAHAQEPVDPTTTPATTPTATTTTPATTPTTTPTTTTTTPGKAVLDPEQPVVLPEAATAEKFKRKAATVVDIVERSSDATLSCEQEVCPAMAPLIAAAATDETGAQVKSSTAAERLVGLLNDVRKSKDETPEPLGALVTFEVELKGLRGKEVLVDWSIFSAGKRLFGQWLANNLAYRLKARTESDIASMDVWVPMPKQAGPFRVRLTLTADGTRLTHTFTEPFG